MQIREWVNKNSAVTTIIALVMLVGALYYLMITIFPPPPPPITQVFFYDVVAGKLFKGPVGEYPPIETPDGNKIGDGPAGVKANVFSCGRCRESEWYIGYLETYLPAARALQIKMTEDAKRSMEMPPPAPGADGKEAPAPMPPPMMGPSPQEMMIISQGHLVATKEDVNKWYQQESPEGAQLVNEAMKKCPDNKYPQQCFPDR